LIERHQGLPNQWGTWHMVAEVNDGGAGPRVARIMCSEESETRQRLGDRPQISLIRVHLCEFVAKLLFLVLSAKISGKNIFKPGRPRPRRGLD
jgi:hypothetical protein